MVWYFALLGIAVPVILVLAKKYYAEKKAEAELKSTMQKKRQKQTRKISVLNAKEPILTSTFCAQNVA